MRKRKAHLSQHETILRHLVLHSHLTALEAIGLYRIFNLKGRVTELRGCKGAPKRFLNDSVNVLTEMRDDGTGKLYARYSLARLEKVDVHHRFPELFNDQKEAA